ncbi:MAG TPA: TonB-dependent receptor, partial [Bacteroidales bacterium]
MRNCTDFVRFIFLFSLILPFDKTSAQNVSNSISIDSVVNYLEQKRNISLYYQSDWFRNKNFHPSVLSLPIDDITRVLKNACNCSFVAIDSASLVFVPNDVSVDANSTSGESVTIIGNPKEYGKYSRATVNGKIIDGKTGEPLIGARIAIEKTKTGAVTDKSGNFTMTLPVGEYDLKLSYIGYEENHARIKLIGNGPATFEIIEKSIGLNEVIVTASRTDNNLISTQMGLVQLNNKDIKELPVVFGETDVIKSTTLLPGVTTIGEFGTGFNVRGGSADQNLILIEDVPIFNSSHLFGLTSIVNSDGVSNVTLLKAGIPAKYGERASSLMDIRMGTTNSDKIRGKAGIGLINSRLTLDAPLFKNKVNLMVGGRTTYSDWLLRRMPDVDLMNSSAKFYDLNGFLTIVPDNNNKISVFGYYSNDDFSFSHNIHYGYSNTLASIRWNHVLNQKLSSSLMTGFSRYNYTVSELDTLSRDQAYKINSDLLYQNVKLNFNWHPTNDHAVDFGVNGVYYAINPGDLSKYDTLSTVVPMHVNKERAGEFALYAGDDFNITPKIAAEVGVRYSLYLLLGPGTVNMYRSGSPIIAENIIDSISYSKNEVIKSYHGLEPRLSLRYSIDEFSSVKASYNRMNQYINLISNASVMTPTDVWKLSDRYERPLRCDQFAIGYFRNFKQNAIETSVEIYYKLLKDVIEYKNGAQILLNNHIETDLVNAKGVNYGAEFYVKKNTGRLTGWASYTYSRSMRQTNGAEASEQINSNNYFPSNYDKPHNIVINANYHISRRWRFAGSFLYSTGRPTTLPELKYNFN